MIECLAHLDLSGDTVKPRVKADEDLLSVGTEPVVELILQVLLVFRLHPLPNSPSLTDKWLWKRSRLPLSDVHAVSGPSRRKGRRGYSSCDCPFLRWVKDSFASGFPWEGHRNHSGHIMSPQC